MTNAAVHEGIEVDRFERKLAYLICYYFGTPFQYLLHDAPVIAAWFSYLGVFLANLTFKSFFGFFVAFWGLIYEWVKCAYFDGCIVIGKPEFADVPSDYKSDIVKTGPTLVAVRTGVKLSAPLLWATVGLADRFTLHVGALVAQKFADVTSSAPCSLSAFDRFKRKIQYMFFLGSVRVMMPATETVLAPVQMKGNYTYTLETHSAPYEPFELEDEVWQRKAVSFWLVDEKKNSIKPIGLAGVVSGALLTNRHVFDAIEAAYACQKKVFVSAVRREVKSTLGMVLYEPKEQIGPSDRNGVAFPVSSDFTLLPLPPKFAQLGVKSGGAVQFGSTASKVVTGGFYKSDGISWKFFLSPGITSPCNLVLGGVAYPGVSTWSGFSTHGASGCPLYSSSNGELIGLNVGAVSSGDGSDKMAIFIRSSAILGYYLAKSKGKNHFKGNRFGLLDLVSTKVGKQAVANQLEVEEHSTPDGQRDLDPTWYDDQAEDMAEAFRAARGEGDEQMGEWAWLEEQKRDELRATGRWLDNICAPGGSTGIDLGPKTRSERKKRKDSDDEQDNHDGSSLKPVNIVEEPEKNRSAKNVDESEKAKPGTSKWGLAKKIGCLGALFWGAVDVNERLREAKLADSERDRKREIILNLTEKFPLSQFEREFCSTHTFDDKAEPFAYDKEGNLLLEQIGTAGKSRVDVGARKKKRGKAKNNEPEVDNATKITRSLKERLGIDFKPVAAETGHKAQRDSLIANCLKAIPDRFKPDKDHLRAFEAVHCVPFTPPNLNDPVEVERLIRDAICNMNKTRSAGSDGFSRGHNDKGSFLEADILSIIDATKRRLARLGYVGKDIGLFTGAELVKYGLRGIVMPSIKGEWHTEKKVFEMVKQEDGTNATSYHQAFFQGLYQTGHYF